MGIAKTVGIKSVSRGVLTITAGNLTATATIPAVNTAKSELRFLGVSDGSGDTNPSKYLVRLYLNNSTTVGAIKEATTVGSSNVTWELTEWY